MSDSDAAFIAAARSALPKLIAVAEAARTLKDAVKFDWVAAPTLEVLAGLLTEKAKLLEGNLAALEEMP